MNMFLLMLLAVVGILSLGCVCRGAIQTGRIATAANIGGGRYMDGKPPRTTEAAFGTRYLLCTKGVAADGIIVCTASTLPLGVVTDEPASGDVAAVELLSAPGTKLLVASEIIAVDEPLYAAASGKVQNQPAAAGTYYRVGRAIGAAGADGDEIQAETHAPIRVHIVANAADIAALKLATATPGELMFLQA
jgi:hypothetical protein